MIKDIKVEDKMLIDDNCEPEKTDEAAFEERGYELNVIGYANRQSLHALTMLVSLTGSKQLNKKINNGCNDENDANYFECSSPALSTGIFVFYDDVGEKEE